MILLVTLPCDCLVDPEDFVADESECGRYVACPWCSSVFNWRELTRWFSSNDEMEPRSMWGRAPLPLIRFGATVLEVTEFCGGCGAPMVRECAEKVVFHLAVPPSAIESLLN